MKDAVNLLCVARSKKLNNKAWKTSEAYDCLILILANKNTHHKLNTLEKVGISQSKSTNTFMNVNAERQQCENCL